MHTERHMWNGQPPNGNGLSYRNSYVNLPLMTGLSQPIGGIIGLMKNGHSTGGEWTGGDLNGGNGLIILILLVEGQQPGKFTTMGDSAWGEGGPLSGQITAFMFFLLFFYVLIKGR